MFERTIWWGAADHAELIDQTRLPHEEAVVRWRTLDDAVAGIVTMQVRGAPLIGVAAAYGVALAMMADPATLDVAIDRLGATRPTAVNLAWALRRVGDILAPLPLEARAEAARDLAVALADADAAACRAIGEAGVAYLAEIHDRTGRPVEILTHCNAGWLACVEWGTATAPIYVARERDLPVHVWVSETRPRNQGAALTTWELGHRGVPHTLVVDSAAGHLLRTGRVDVVMVGADRVAANGDVANKVGTSLKALAARDCGVPFLVAAPRSSFDADCPTGAAIPIEERDSEEVLIVNGRPIAPAGTPARNWGFDVTPARLIDAYLTERGALRPADLEGFLRG